MAKTKISEFSATPGNNTDIDGINIAEGCAPSGINDAIRELMAQLKDFQAGTAGDSFNGPIGTTTAAAGAFTTLSSTGNTTLGDASGDVITINGTTTFANANPTLSAGTANGVAYLNASKVLTTGSGLTFDGTNLSVGGGTAVAATAGGGVTAGLFAARSALTAHQTATGVFQYTSNEATIRVYGSTGVTGQLAFNLGAGGSADAEQMRLTSTGLGIGTSSPAAKFQVATAAGSPTSVSSGIRVYETTGNYGLNIGGDGTYGYIQGLRGAAGTLGYNDLVLQPNSGNLGLGVTPSAWGRFRALQGGLQGGGALTFDTLDYQTNLVSNAYFDGTNWRYLASPNQGAAYYTVNRVGHAWYTAPSGTAGNPISFTQAMTLTQGGSLLVGTTVDNGDKLAVDGGNLRIQSGNRLRLVNSDNTNSATIWNPAGTGGGNEVIAFQTGATERARITSGGYFKASNTGSYGGVGAFGNAVNEPYAVIQTNAADRVAAFINSNNTGTAAGAVTTQLLTGAGYHFESILDTGVVYRVLANGNVQNSNNSYGAISDLKLKENITDATPKLSGLNQLRVVNYNLKGNTLKQIGLIAQEVEQVFPGLVEETPDVDPDTKEPTGTVTKAVKYSVLVPMLLKAVQELSAEVNALKAQVQGA